MENGGARGDEQEAETQTHALARFLDHHAPKAPPPRPEIDRRTNYRTPPPPPGVNLTSASVEDAVRRDPDVQERAYEVARATARDHATERRSLHMEASSGRDLVAYLAAYRPIVHPELGERIDATLDRHLRDAYAASTRTRLVCPFCSGATVVPTPDLKTLLCLDYECAPKAPRRIDPTYAQEPERRITAKQLALLAGEEDAAMRKKLTRAKIKPVHKGPHNRFEYRWADVAHLVGPKLPTQPPPSAPAANRESRSGAIVHVRAA